MAEGNEQPSPHFLQWLIGKFIPEELQEEFLGDLEEVFRDRIAIKGKRYALLMCGVDTLHLLLGFGSFNVYNRLQSPLIMHRQYVISAYRNFTRQRIPSLIKTIGLSVGLATCILITFYIRYELSFDRFHKSPQRVYRLLFSQLREGKVKDVDITMPNGILPYIKEAIDPNASATYVLKRNSFLEAEGNTYSNIASIRTDTSFFKVFSFPSVQEKELSFSGKPGRAIVTASLGKKLFGTENPVGKLFSLRGSRNTTSYLVEGVLQDIPKNSHLRFDVILPTLVDKEPLKEEGYLKKGWNTNGEYIYVRMPNGVGQTQLNSDLKRIVRRFEVEDRIAFESQKLTDIHLYSSFLGEKRGNIREVYLFAIIAVLILFIGLINYILIVQADFTRRIREIGIRKSTGALKRDIINQFITETGVNIFFSFPLVALLIWGFFSTFSKLMNRPLSVNELPEGWLWALLIVTIVVAILIAGILPAWRFGQLKVVSSLKREAHPLFNRHTSTKVLLIIQFVITLTLISCLGILHRQISFTQQKDLGFNRENRLLIPAWMKVPNIPAFKREITQHASVISSSTSYWKPGDYSQSILIGHPLEKEEKVIIQFINGDEHLVPSMGLEIIQGGNLTPVSHLDSIEPSNIPILVNELFVKEFQLSQPIGQKYDQGSLSGTIVGVVKDFNMKDLYVPIVPTIIKYDKKGVNVLIHYQEGKEKELLEHIKNIWPIYAAVEEPSYQFLDDWLDQLYEKEQRLQNIIGVFSGIAILLACLGVLGLAAFSVERRSKEIGIRKVMGASVRQILALLNKDFLPLLILGVVFAVPISIGLMRNWLDQFAYRINIGPWEFILALLFLVSIIFLTVSLRSMRIALANPVEALRQE
ncbi:MAG: FtsX-like permease family protein [Bacteroidota bacterium]